MASVDSRYWIVLNGEIYNYRELRADLKHFPFRTVTVAEKRFRRLSAPKSC
jgi:asparagine synthetase B (glutamine-hydrolysing)